MRLLTVGLPVHNAMPYLPEAVQSILQQTYREFELFVIDDGSTDGSLDYLKTVKDHRVRLVSQENRGLTGTLNRMLAEASTPWLVRHDADDIAFPDRLMLTADHIRRFPEAGMFYSYARHYYHDRAFGHFRSTTASPQELRSLTQQGYLLAICHPTATLNVAKTLEIGGYRFDLHVEDIDLWWRMALAYDMQLIPTFTIAFRQNAGSVSTNNFERQCVNTIYVQYLLLSHLWNLSPLPYSAVYDRLRLLLDHRRMRFREHARLANICFGQQRRREGLGHVWAALIASPEHFGSRVLHEFRPPTAVINGEDPAEFLQQKRFLWPEGLSFSPPRSFATSPLECKSN
jgi:glycosyltransferase involved in cell wall biosynthesis